MKTFKERLEERLREYRGERFSRVEDYPDFTAGARAALELAADEINDTRRIRQTKELANEAEKTACKIADELRTRAKELSDG